MVIRIGAKPTPINIIQAYAATAKARDDEIEEFYRHLENMITSIAKNKVTLTLGGGVVGAVMEDF
jgi:uracil-DNA glycosylase